MVGKISSRERQSLASLCRDESLVLVHHRHSHECKHMTRLAQQLIEFLRMGPFRRQALVTVQVYCVNRGHGYDLVLPGQPNYYAASVVVEMVECPECGLFTVCSD